MTNKTTPDDDWLDEILNTLELKIIPEEGYIAPKVHAEAKQAINAKITELLVEERINVWRAILGVDFDQFYPEDKYQDFISIPSHWINQEISEYKMQAQLNKEIK